MAGFDAGVENTERFAAADPFTLSYAAATAPHPKRTVEDWRDCRYC
jgi:hypothetical protein